MIALAKAAGKAPLYIVHVSAKESVNLIREARKAGDTSLERLVRSILY